MTRGIANDWSGKRVGNLTVGTRVASDKQSNAQWSCKCDCGNEVVVRGTFLKRQSYCSQSCSLLLEKIRLDITGQRFGRLIAVRFIGVGTARKSKWLFLCDCGNQVETFADEVLNGNTRSCKCIRVKHGLSSTLEYHRDAHKRWAERNPDKVLENVKKRQIDLAPRIPKWLTDEDRKKINAIYRESKHLSMETGLKHHVDHEIPLRGKTVSGLHVPSNLRVLTATKNLHKSRTFSGEIC